jgi:hypothetical protein
LVLGKETARFMCKAFPGQFPSWEKIKTLKEFYASENTSALVDFEGEKILFLFVIHPSFNAVNRSRIWGLETGVPMEVQLLRKHIAGLAFM